MRRTAFFLTFFAVVGFVEADHFHKNGESLTKGKPDGKHEIHKTTDGHVGHAHIKGGKIEMVSIEHKGKAVATKKYKSEQIHYALENRPNQGPFTQTEPDGTVHVFAATTENAAVGWYCSWSYVNVSTGHSTFFWFHESHIAGSHTSFALYVKN